MKKKVYFKGCTFFVSGESKNGAHFSHAHYSEAGYKTPDAIVKWLEGIKSEYKGKIGQVVFNQIQVIPPYETLEEE